MKLQWQTSNRDVERVQKLIENQKTAPFVELVQVRNLSFPREPLTRDRLWRALVCTRLSKIQQVGPRKRVARIALEHKFALSYEDLPKRNMASIFYKRLKKAGLSRLSTKIPRDLVSMVAELDNGGWAEVFNICGPLSESAATRQPEKRAAEFMQRFRGIGPNQSRLLLYSLGLTRFEIPIDETLAAWLNYIGFPIQIATSELRQIEYFNLISSGVEALCDQANVMPCILYAAVLSLEGPGAWNDAAMTF